MPASPLILPEPSLRVSFHGPLDLEDTLYSGQAFRWRRLQDGSHQGFIQNRPCIIRREGQRLLVQAETTEEAVRHYFRLDDSHETFLRQVSRDHSLEAALARFPGLRVLRQQPWEMLISFILSQNSNEPKIRNTIEALCRLCDPATPQAPFPEPEALLRLSEQQLRSTGMGYRAPYVRDAARAVHEGQVRPDKLVEIPYQDAFAQLLQIDGIGPKVADCILLYGCDHARAFPTDVWVKRFLRETYLRRRNPRPEEIRAFAWKRFGPYAGFAQHYLFHYRRMVGRLEAKVS